MEIIFPRMYGIYRHLFLQHTIAEIKEFNVKHSLYDTLYAKAGNKFMAIAVRSPTVLSNSTRSMSRT